MKVCTFYTDDSYKAHAERLEKSVKALGWEFVSESLPDKGSVKANWTHKPAFIRKQLEQNRCPILWIDADAEIKVKPTLLETISCNVAAHHSGLFMAGTIFFCYGDDITFSLFDKWEALIAEGIEEPIAFSRAVEETPNLRVSSLPPTYCWVERWMRQRFPMASPVIEQFAVSQK
jgi:hypothetical protein